MQDLAEPFKLVRNQVVAYTGTPGLSAATGSTINVVRIVLATAGFVAFGSAPTAGTSDLFLPALWPEYFIISPGNKISIVQLSSGGNAYIGEMSK